MSVLSNETVKAGWLHRQSSVLKKWKRYWFTLTRDGILRYFDGENTQNAEDGARMKADCVKIITSNDILNVSPPEGCGRSSLLSIEFRNKTWNLCAESPDDMQAWRIALEESRYVNPNPQYPGGPQTTTVITNTRGYPTQQRIHGYPSQQTVHTYPGQTIIHSNPGQPIHYAPQQSPYAVAGYPGATVIPPGQPGGNTTVIVREDPYYNRRNNDVAMGMVAGSMMWGPVLWW